MSTFAVKVYELAIEPHPNADKLELARVGDFRVVVGKGLYKTGDLGAYIPEAAVLPLAVQERLDLVGKLSGANKDRVKAVFLRGALSQGVIYPAKPEWTIGQDVAAELDIVKYVPPVPPALAGSVRSGGQRFQFDIENIKAYPDLIKDGEHVVMTEKLHGTCCIIGLINEKQAAATPDLIDGRFQISTKKFANDGQYFYDCEQNKSNTYLRAFRKYPQIAAGLLNLKFPEGSDANVFILGEIFGAVQDLKYGSAGDIMFRAFAIGSVRNDCRIWIPYDDFLPFCQRHEIPMAPVLYRGPFSREALAAATNGKETISGKELHMREGVVVTPEEERMDPRIGRVTLKSVSDDYLKRKGQKNAQVVEEPTEFE